MNASGWVFQLPQRKISDKDILQSESEKLSMLQVALMMIMINCNNSFFRIFAFKSGHFWAKTPRTVLHDRMGRIVRRVAHRADTRLLWERWAFNHRIWEVFWLCVTLYPLGIPMISVAQRNKTSRYFDMTTVATFLSGVTASMIQTTADDAGTTVGVLTNTFFFSSLVFSIGSAINSLLVISWRRSIVFVIEFVYCS